jgi:D-alanyl-D-alanine carboxypeptidase/D-alanyl-D-alanine-endopeptidase (penicillin-binding protein 4)
LILPIQRILLLHSILCLYTVVRAQTNFTTLENALIELEKKEAYQKANISLCIVDSAKGNILFQHKATTLLAPASTLKTFTTATALHLLGNDFRFRTNVMWKGTIKNSEAQGELIVYASGDPTFGSDRFKETQAENIKKQILQSLQKLNIKKWKGRLRIVPNAFVDSAIHTDWLAEDVGNYYGAGIYPLNWRENKFEINLQPNSTSFDVISNSAGYDNRTSFCIELVHKDGASTEEAFAFIEKEKNCMYTIRGVLSNKEKNHNMQLARLHPAEDFKKEVMQYLQKEIDFTEKSNVETEAKEILLCQFQSPPLQEIVYWCNQKSLNVYAEALCKQIAVTLFKKGTWPLGTSAMIRYTASLGLQTEGVHLKDGSGLSTENKIHTRLLSQLLHHYTKEKWFRSFYESLPSINGLKMKSGYIGGTRAYAGYMPLRNGSKTCFAFIIHNYSCTPREVKREMFGILDMLK